MVVCEHLAVSCGMQIVGNGEPIPLSFREGRLSGRFEALLAPLGDSSAG